MLKPLLAAIAVTLFAMSCGSLKTKQEFVRDDLKDFDQTHFTVTGTTIEEVRKRMAQYAGNCLGMKGSSYMANATPGTGGASFDTTYTPSMDQEGKKTSLYLAFDQRGSFGTGGAMYVFLGQIWKGTAANTVEGTSYFRKSSFGIDTSDVSTRMIAWLKNEKKMCPSLQQ